MNQVLKGDREEISILHKDYFDIDATNDAIDSRNNQNMESYTPLDDTTVTLENFYSVILNRRQKFKKLKIVDAAILPLRQLVVLGCDDGSIHVSV